MSGEISTLDELVSWASGDKVEIVDVSDTSMAAAGTNKRITLANLFGPASTFTPTLVGTSTAGSHTYTTQTGRYVRHVNVVYFQLELDVSAVDAGWAGQVRIGGLPIAPAGDVESPVALADIDNIAYGDMLTGYVHLNAQQIALFKHTSGTSNVSAALATTDVGSSVFVRASGLYFV